MSIFGYILLGIWGAAYFALGLRRMQRRHRAVRISGEIARPDLEVTLQPAVAPTANLALQPAVPTANHALLPSRRAQR